MMMNSLIIKLKKKEGQYLFKIPQILKFQKVFLKEIRHKKEERFILMKEILLIVSKINLKVILHLAMEEGYTFKNQKRYF